MLVLSLLIGLMQVQIKQYKRPTGFILNNVNDQAVLIQQGHLFDKSIMVERTLSTGSIVRLKLEPLEGQKVKVLEYYRKGFLSDRFKRHSEEEGKVFAFGDLKLPQSFEALFD